MNQNYDITNIAGRASEIWLDADNGRGNYLNHCFGLGVSWRGYHLAGKGRPRPE